MPKSRFEGKMAKASLNRTLLKNAIELGVNRIGIDPDELSPLICYGEQTMFVIMALEGDEPTASSVTMLQTDSTPVVVMPTTVKESEMSPEVKPKTSRSRQTNTQVADNTPAESMPAENTDDHSKSTSRSEALAEAEELYGILRDATNRVKTLIRQIKGSRQHERELLRREQEIDKRRQRLVEAATLIGKV